ncbi:MAG: hypothetical protein IIA11_08015 [Proteobacteria bacterium]|nr:hypothetical protein [Pseudomonadota bacterium]
MAAFALSAGTKRPMAVTVNKINAHALARLPLSSQNLLMPLIVDVELLAVIAPKISKSNVKRPQLVRHSAAVAESRQALSIKNAFSGSAYAAPDTISVEILAS